MDLEVVAEGIETMEQWDFLATEECARGQGFFFSQPLPSDQFLQLLINPDEGLRTWRP
jgi:EAL domain-containing protein (putative c-di-GMP-specific phosphodiesterase class I)